MMYKLDDGKGQVTYVPHEMLSKGYILQNNAKEIVGGIIRILEVYKGTIKALDKLRNSSPTIDKSVSE